MYYYYKQSTPTIVCKYDPKYHLFDTCPTIKNYALRCISKKDMKQLQASELLPDGYSICFYCKEKLHYEGITTVT